MKYYLFKNIEFKIALICLLLSNYCYSAKFNDHNTSYIFAPGLNAYETQLAKYTPKFTAITGEKVSSKIGIHVINQPVTICKFPEIKLQSTKKSFLNPIEWISSTIMKIRNSKFGIKITGVKPEDEHTIEGHASDITKINLAQEADINALTETYNKHITQYPDSDVSLFGTSRGAATTFDAIAKNKFPQVKTVVLEGIFDSIPHLLRHKFKLTYNVVKSIISKITSYKPNGICPYSCINEYPKDLPTLIISSKKDELVPYCCSKKLYNKLKKAGYSKVHFLVLENSSHSGYSCDDQKDKEMYESVLHAFYKHYNQAHDPELAKAGEPAWQKILAA